MFAHNGTFSYFKYPINDPKSDSRKYLENVVEHLSEHFWEVPGINALIEISMEASRICLMVADSFLTWGSGWETVNGITYSNKYYCEPRYKSAKYYKGYLAHDDEDTYNHFPSRRDRKNKKKGKDVADNNRNSWVEKFVNGITYRYNEILKIWLPFSYSPVYHHSSNVQLFTTEEYDKLDSPECSCNICDNILKEQQEWKRGLCYHCQVLTMANSSDVQYEAMLKAERDYTLSQLN